MNLAVLFVVAACLAAALTPLMRHLAHATGVVDVPGMRKVHRVAVARTGGMAVVLASGLAVALFVWLDPQGAGGAGVWSGPMVPLLAAAALVFAVGAADDMASLPAWLKLGVETGATALVISAGITISHVTFFGTTYALGPLAPLVTWLWVLAVTNAFNLMDGLDGLATGLAIIAAATCATVLMARGHTPEAVLLIALAGALSGFLPFNIFPASVFLGDAGSLVIGFILAVTAMTGWQKGTTVLAGAVPLLIFALPLADLAVVAVRRMSARTPDGPARGAWAALHRVLQPDQRHVHHRLLALGYSQWQVVLMLHGLALLCSLLALLSFRRS